MSRKGKFTASRISELLAKGSGRTAISYCLDLAMETIGVEDDYESAEMRHGRANQYVAFDQVILPRFPNAKWHDQFIEIDDESGASPDVLIGDMPLDIKCPYYIDTFAQQTISTPKKYETQVQMQMMATKGTRGYLCYFLTKAEKFGEIHWAEYPKPLKERTCLIEFTENKLIREAINDAIKFYSPIKNKLVDLLLMAKELTFDEYWDLSIKQSAIRKVKDSDNPTALKEVLRYENDFYYKKQR